MELEHLKGFIVKKLFHHGYIGGRHTDIENLKKGLPVHVKGDVKEAAKELIKKERAINALKILQENGWFNNYLIEEALREVQDG